MKADVILQYLAHQTVDPTTNRGEQHKLVAAVLVVRKRPLHRIQLAAKTANSLQQFHLFPLVRRREISPFLRNTYPGYTISLRSHCPHLRTPIPGFNRNRVLGSRMG